MRGVLVGYINEKVDKYPDGSILMDAPRHSSAEGLIEATSDKADWNISVNAVDWKPKANPKDSVDANASAKYIAQMKKDMMFRQ